MTKKHVMSPGNGLKEHWARPGAEAGCSSEGSSGNFRTAVCFGRNLLFVSAECRMHRRANVAVFTELSLPLVGEQEFQDISEFLIGEQCGVAIGHGGNG